jgi:hypothetical protein
MRSIIFFFGEGGMHRNLFVAAILAIIMTFALPSHAVTAVFDLDWTIIYRVFEAADLQREPESIIEFGGLHYRLADYSAESIELLHRAGVEVVFFSGGPADRNRHVIDKLYQRVNRIATSPRTPVQILSHDQLTELAPESSGLSFPDRFKKDLLKAVRRSELPVTVLIDDIARFSVKGQEQNMLSFSAYRDHLHFPSPVRRRVPHEFDPPHPQAWHLERHKILLATEAILRSLEHPRRETGFLSRLHKLFGARPDQAMTLAGDRVHVLLASAFTRLRQEGFEPLERSLAIEANELSYDSLDHGANAAVRSCSSILPSSRAQ